MFRSGDKNIEFRPNEIIYTELIDQSGNIGKIVINLTTTKTNAHLSIWDAKNFKWYNIYELNDIVTTYPTTEQKVEWQYFIKDRSRMIRIFRFLFKYTTINTTNNDETSKDEDVIDTPSYDMSSEATLEKESKNILFSEIEKNDILMYNNQISVVILKNDMECHLNTFTNMDDAMNNINGRAELLIPDSQLFYKEKYKWIGKTHVMQSSSQPNEPSLSKEDEDLINMI